jgi:PilZ domain
MTLSSMVVSRDWQEVSVLECILGSLHMDVAVENEPHKALTRISRSKIDALIVDCDLNGSTQFLREVQRVENRAKTVPLVIMGAARSNPSLEASGALFAFEKPISVEQAVRTLSAARNMILDGRLRYHRAGLKVPVALKSKGLKAAEAYLVNVSQGGMQIHTDDAVSAGNPMQVSCELPGAKWVLKAQAEIVWQDKLGNVGIRFEKVTPRLQQTLRLWLAQQYFAN